jgi:long-chain acyl-CoA synthetase
MPIIEVYGLTECTGATHYNRLDNPVFGTVGPHLDGMECKIARDGEILLRGANVFSGYFNDPKATSLAFDGEWFCTGDIGIIDEHGNLKITDRKKSLIVTAAGKNIAPAPLEAQIKKHSLISQVVVIGDRRKYLTALITLVSGAMNDQKSRQEIERHLQKINTGLASFETIKNFTILENDFTIDTGELTPTLKIKRNTVQEKYKTLIDSMYVSPPEGAAFDYEHRA